MRAAFVCLLVLGCSPSPPPELPPAPEKKDVVAPKLPEQFIDRRRLEAVLQEGPGWLLERVPIEEVLEGESFVGWRVRDLPVELSGVDLRSGDVVTAVNGMPLETPPDFWAAWTTLTVASELTIAYVREGEPRELRVPILGSPNPAVAEELKQQQGEAPPERPTEPRQRRKETIVIEPHEKPSTDTITDYSE
jgi:hypothetical protein